MSFISIKTPAPTYKINRRKCGWGSVITSCDICGKMMIGHNRGICSRCKRSIVGDRPTPHFAKIPSHHSYKSALRAQAIENRVVYFQDAAKTQKGGSK